MKSVPATSSSSSEQLMKFWESPAFRYTAITVLALAAIAGLSFGLTSLITGIHQIGYPSIVALTVASSLVLCATIVALCLQCRKSPKVASQEKAEGNKVVREGCYACGGPIWETRIIPRPTLRESLARDVH